MPKISISQTGADTVRGSVIPNKQDAQPLPNFNNLVIPQNNKPIDPGKYVFEYCILGDGGADVTVTVTDASKPQPIATKKTKLPGQPGEPEFVRLVDLSFTVEAGAKLKGVR